MEKYIYRVLNDMDEVTSDILCKKYIDYSPWLLLLNIEYTFGEALDNVTSHLLKGNTAYSVWISCSKNFNILRHFATSQTDKRPFFAIIKNHSQCTPDIFNYYKYLFQLYGVKDVNYIRNLLDPLS